MTPLPISPLSLDCLTRDYFGSFDAAILAQLAPLAVSTCYQPKIYRAPAVGSELIAASGYASYGLKITPGSLIYSIYLPVLASEMPGPAMNVQVRNEDLKMDWWDQPIPAYFVANAKYSYLSASQVVAGAFPHLFVNPHPAVGKGLFQVQLWSTSNAQQRFELVFGALEPVGEACL